MPECSLLFSVLLTPSCVSEFKNDSPRVAFFFFNVSYSMWDLSSPTRDWTHNPYIGSTESQPLGHQGNPNVSFLDHQNNVAIQSHSIITLHFYFLYNSSITFFCFIIYVYLFASLFMWKKWQPIAVFLPEKLFGQRSPSGYSPWDCKELDTTEHSTAAAAVQQTVLEVNLLTVKLT